MAKKKDVAIFVSIMNEGVLLRSCRYYKGEIYNPFIEGDCCIIWSYEKSWVELSEKGSPLLKEAEKRYNELLGDFSAGDGVPVSLKGLLFNRYEHMMNGSPDSFKHWYKSHYLCLS